MRFRSHFLRVVLFAMGWLLASLLGGAGNLAHAQKPLDVAGWGETRWGMSAADLRRIFGANLTGPERRPGGAYYQTDTTDIFTEKFSVSLVLGEKGREDRLYKVFLLSDHDGIGLKAVPDRKDVASKIRSAMASKYGLPEALEDKEERNISPGIPGDRAGNFSRTWQYRWILPTTVITFSYWRTEVFLRENWHLMLDIILIEYEQSDIGKL